MAERNTGGEAVKRGIIGTGEAQVLGQALNPLDYYIRGRMLGAQGQANKAKEAEVRRKRDKEFRDLYDYDDAKIWEPFEKWKIDNVRQFRNFVRDQRRAGVDFSDANFQDQVGIYKDRIDQGIADADNAKQFYEGMSKELLSGKYKDYYNDKAYSALNDAFFSPDGRAINPPGGFNFRELRQSIMDNPENLAKDAIIEDTIKNIGTATVEFYNQRNTANGTAIHDIEKLKGKLFAKDAEGNVLRGKNNLPYVNVDDDSAPVLLNNGFFKKVVEATLKERGLIDQQTGTIDDVDNATRNRVMTELVGPSIEFEQDRTIKGAGKGKFNWSIGGGYSVEEAEAQKRVDRIADAVWNGEEGALGSFRDVKNGVDLEFGYTTLQKGAEGPDPMTTSGPPTRLYITIDKGKTKKYDLAKRQTEDLQINGNTVKVRRADVEVPDVQIFEFDLTTEEGRDNAMTALNNNANYLEGGKNEVPQDDFYDYYTEIWKQNRQPGDVYKKNTKKEAAPDNDTGGVYQR
jgi:hypothetical protein